MTTTDGNPATGRVLVTGAGGFIGSHLVEMLVASGRPVRALLRYTSEGRFGLLAELVARMRAAGHEPSPSSVGPNAVAFPQLEIVWGDVTDAAQMQSVCRGCDAVLHLAALIGIPYSYHAVASYLAVNAGGTMNLLDAARAQGVRLFVHTSTSEVYGTAETTPISLRHPLRAQSPYAATKIAADKLVESYAASFGFPGVTLRPFNTYGPRQSARAVIPTVIAQALAGPAIRLGTLDAVRDFTFVEDTCRAYLLALERPLAPGSVVQLGTGEAVSVGEVVARVGRILGRELSVSADAQRVRPEASEVRVLLSDNASARDALGWSPAVTLDEGLRRTVEWFRASGSGQGVHYRV